MLTEISTADGFKILFRYTTKGALKEIVDSRGETLYVNTDCQGRVEKISDERMARTFLLWATTMMHLVI